MSTLLDFATRDTPDRDPEALAGLNAASVFDFVQCVPWRRDRAVRADGGIMAPVMYEITGSDACRDKPFIGEVIDVGPGVTDQNGTRENMCVAKGDVFICTVHNISYRVTERGRKTYMVRNGVVYAKVIVKDATETDDAMVSDILNGHADGPKEITLKPVQDLILVKKNEERALLHMRGRAALPGGELWLPTESMSTDDVRSPAIVAEYGEVVAVGPGRWRDGRWSQPPCKAGDLILYDASYSTLPVRIHGESFTLVPAPQLVKIADVA